MDILCFGEVLFDIIEGKAYAGGAPMNFAAHSARLGSRPFLLSRVGDDQLGKKAFGQIKDWGVETKFIQTDPDHPTGTVDVKLTEGSPSYTIHEQVAYDYIDLEEFIVHYTVAEFDFLYFGTLAQRNEVSRSTLLQVIEDIDFPEIFFDVNLRQSFYTPEIIHTSLHKATIFKLNDEEVQVLSELLYNGSMDIEEFCRTVAVDFMLKVVLVTQGEGGCTVYTDEELHQVSGVPATVVDTVGAGDSFSAAFMYFYHQSANAVEAAVKANKLGAYVASSRGAVPEYSPDIRKDLFGHDEGSV